jgi:hypothetical protein
MRGGTERGEAGPRMKRSPISSCLLGSSRRPPEVNEDSPDPEGRGKQPNSRNLQHLREFVAPDAGVCWVSCWTLPYFTHSDVELCRSS